MTQRDLGQAVGYSEAQIARLEGGSRLPDVVAVKGVFVEALGLKH
jgi:predicted transcriptional regulator